MKLSHKFRGYYANKSEEYLHELVKKDHSTQTNTGNRLCQLNKANSEIVAISSVITKVMRNDVITPRTNVPLKTNLVIKNSLFRNNSHKMTGKTAGANKAPPIGTAPVVTTPR